MIQELASVQWKRIQVRKSDLRYIRTVGKLTHAGLLMHTHIEPYPQKITLDDALWSGDIEPRILELIPAILLKKPGFFKEPLRVPKDLELILKDIRHGRAPQPFRSVPAEKYMPWLLFVGHKDKWPTVLKSFRFNQEDIESLHRLKNKYNESEIAVIRRAIRNLISQKAAYFWTPNKNS